jgi:hypothetical protein
VIRRRLQHWALAVVAGLLLTVGPGWIEAGAASSAPLSSVVLARPGPGYSVISQGPVVAGSIATSSPNPAAAATALSQLAHSGSVTTYQRVWKDSSGDNEVQDLVVKFDAVRAATAFSAAVQKALAAGEVVTSGSIYQPPGAYRTTYFATTATQVGVGQAITLQSGRYVATLSFFSSNAANNTHPITIPVGQKIAEAQYVDLPHALGGHTTGAGPNGASHWWTWVLLTAALIIVVAAVGWSLRRRHKAPLALAVALTTAQPAPELFPESPSPASHSASPVEAPPSGTFTSERAEPTAPRQHSGVSRMAVPATAVAGAVALWWLRRRRPH